MVKGRGKKPGVYQPHKVYYMINAGERLREAMFAKGMTVTALAKESGVNYATLYLFMYNGTDISSARLSRACYALGVSADYILGLTELKEARA